MHAGLEREALQLKREEARLVKEIKACAAKGNQPATRQLAKSLVRIRQQVGVRGCGAANDVTCHRQKSFTTQFRLYSYMN